MSHSAVQYLGRFYMFGGCFMYNRRRQLRELVNSVSYFDPGSNSLHKPRLRKYNSNSSFLLKPRKNHCALIFCKTSRYLMFDLFRKVNGGVWRLL